MQALQTDIPSEIVIWIPKVGEFLQKNINFVKYALFCNFFETITPVWTSSALIREPFLLS